MKSGASIGIRPASTGDFDAIYAIFQTVVAAGDTYTWTEATTREEAYAIFFADDTDCCVAVDGDAIVGAYFVHPNQPGRGAHVANAGYMVAPAARGRGIAKQLCLHSLDRARARGYRAMQYNIVVSTNTAAIAAWTSCGFAIIGTAQGVFAHAEHGYVDAHIMFREL